MNSVASPAYSPVENTSHVRHYTPDPDMNRVISSTWHVLEQMPPPSLREVLGAYNLKGDGDRDMLIAMLNAKSAEDQRMASVAALHRTLLEIHTPPASPPLSTSQLHMHPTTHFYPPSPVLYSPPTHEKKPSHDVSNSHTEPSPPVPTRKAPPPSASTQPSRKRQRTSRDSSLRPTSRESHASTKHDSPPSPHSSSRSDSAEYSPRSRASMAIGSLLSSGPSSGDISGRGITNDYISPPTSLGPISV